MVLEGTEFKKKKNLWENFWFCCFLLWCIMNKTTKPTSKPRCIRAGGSTVRLQDRRHRGEAWETFGEVAGSAHKPGSMLPMANTRTAPWMNVPNIPLLSQPSPAICGECWAGLAEQWKGRKRHLSFEGGKRQFILGEQGFGDSKRESSCSCRFGVWKEENTLVISALLLMLSVVLYCTSPLYVRECQKSKVSLGALKLCGQAQITWVSAFGLGSQLRLGPFRLFPVSKDLNSLVQSYHLQGMYKEMLFPWAGKGILLF